MKKLIVVSFMVLMVTSTIAQYRYKIVASGNALGCTPGKSITNTITVTFNGSSGSVSNSSSFVTGTPLAGTYSESFPSSMTIAGGFICACVGEPGCTVSGSATISAPSYTVQIPTGINLCEGVFNLPTVSNSKYTVSAHLVIWKAVLSPPVNISSNLEVCTGAGVTLNSTEPLSSYSWEVARGAGSFIPFRSTTSSQTTITQTDLAGIYPNPSGQFSFRVRNLNCSDPSLSTPISGIKFWAPMPSASVQFSAPSCNGGSDGKISISSLTGFVNQYEITLKRQIGAAFVPVPGSPYFLAQPISFPVNLHENGFVIPSGNYELIIGNNEDPTNLGGCPFSITQLIIDPPPFTITEVASIGSVSCNNLDTGPKVDGYVQLSLHNGSPPYSYQYDFGSGFTSISPNNSSTISPILGGLGVGNYQFKATYQNSSTGIICESNTVSSINITQPAPLTLTSSKTNILCLGKNRGSINTTVTGGNGGYNYGWTATGTYTPYSIPSVEDPVNLFAGDYSLTVTDSKGCSNVTPMDVTITEPSLPLILNATIPSRLLYGGFDMTCALNDGIIELDLENETLPVASYTWTKDGSPFTPSSFTYGENLTAGNYGVTIIDGNNCDATTSITLVPHPGITAITKATSDFNGFNTKCPDTNEGSGFVESVTNGFGSISYTWFDGSTDQFIDDLLPGNYVVNVIDGNGCADDATLVITLPPAIQPNIQVTSSYNGESISCPSANDGAMESFPINGFGSYSYLWDHGPTTPAISGLNQNTYSVTVTDDYGCSTKSSLDISDPATMQLNLTKTSYNGSDLTCRDATDGEIQLNVVNGIASYLFSWSEGSTTQNISGLTAGDYSVIVTDQNNCEQTNSITITNPDSFEVQMQHLNNFNGYDVSCKGLADGAAKAFLSGGTAPYTYLWSGGQLSESITNQSADDYTVQLLDANNCTNSGSITLIEPATLQGSVTIDNPVSCFGGIDGQISLVGNGGAGIYSYSLSGVTYQTSNIFSALDIGIKDLFIKDGNGCVTPTQETMTQPDIISISFQNIVEAQCNDPVGSAQAVATGGNGGYNFSWFDDPTNQPMNTGDVLLNAIASIYRVEILDAKNCPGSDLVAVSSIGGAEFNLENITGITCFGFADGSAAINVTSGITPYAYVWSNGQTQPVADNLKAGNYFATVIDGLGCKTIKPLTISTPGALVATYSKTLPNCVGDCDGEINTFVTGGTLPYSYNWTTLLQTTPAVSSLCKGDYNLRITDEKNCLLEELVNLPDPAALQISSNFTRPICLGRCDGSIEAIGQGGTEPYQFQWQGGPASSIYPSICPGDYTVSMVDANGCITTEIKILYEGDPLPIDLGGEATLCVGQSKVLDAGNNWTLINWSSTIGFISKNQIISISSPGYYFLEAVDAIGCIGLDTFKLETSLDLLKAEFIMPSEVVVGDTLVAIDISWPLPDRVEWIYPSSFILLPSDNGDFMFAIIPESGTFTIGMQSFLAECHDFREKELIVQAFEKESSGGRLGFKDNLIQQLSVFPNPNNGRFDVNVLLSEEREVKLQIISFPKGIVEAHYEGPSADFHQVGFELSHLMHGMYFVLMRVGEEQRLVRFIKR